MAGLLPSEACGLNHSIGAKMPFDSSANLAFVAPISANNMCSGEEGATCGFAQDRSDLKKRIIIGGRSIH